MKKDNELTYSEITNLAGQLKVITAEIDGLLTTLKDQDYIRIGQNGDVWTGDAAEVAHQTFEDLFARFPEFSTSINEYADYLVKKKKKK